jgi:hypothetical protein
MVDIKYTFENVIIGKCYLSITPFGNSTGKDSD